MLFGQIVKRFEVSRMVEIVFVQKREVFPARSRHCGVSCHGGPAILLVYHLQAGIGCGELVDKRTGAVLRPVVHENPLPVGKFLRLHGGKSAVKEL